MSTGRSTGTSQGGGNIGPRHSQVLHNPGPAAYSLAPSGAAAEYAPPTLRTTEPPGVGYPPEMVQSRRSPVEWPVASRAAAVDVARGTSKLILRNDDDLSIRSRLPFPVELHESHSQAGP